MRYSYSKPVSGGIETLPVQDLALEMGAVSGFNNPFILSSYFPSLEEFRLLYRTDIRQVYYMGEIDDEKAVEFLNSYTRECKKTGIEDGFILTKIKLNNSQL